MDFLKAVYASLNGATPRIRSHGAAAAAAAPPSLSLSLSIYPSFSFSLSLSVGISVVQDAGRGAEAARARPAMAAQPRSRSRSRGRAQPQAQPQLACDAERYSRVLQLVKKLLAERTHKTRPWKELTKSKRLMIRTGVYNLLAAWEDEALPVKSFSDHSAKWEILVRELRRRLGC